ncbi:hypothetical protein [Streptomyces chartreusis]|uniref:hypothetical protein n=1 Tax=Streptomyces chartreusis TaxID=1969 RepID=UPI0033CD7266
MNSTSRNRVSWSGHSGRICRSTHTGGGFSARQYRFHTASASASAAFISPIPSSPASWGRKTVVTGPPLRHDLADGIPDRLRQRLGIRPGGKVLLIFCGSSGSDRLNAAVRSQLD